MYLEAGSQRPSPLASRRRLFSSHSARRGLSFLGSLGTHTHTHDTRDAQVSWEVVGSNPTSRSFSVRLEGCSAHPTTPSFMKMERSGELH